jgi:hypothetical protein
VFEGVFAVFCIICIICKIVYFELLEDNGVPLDEEDDGVPLDDGVATLPLAPSRPGGPGGPGGPGYIPNFWLCQDDQSGSEACGAHRAGLPTTTVFRALCTYRWLP